MRREPRQEIRGAWQRPDRAARARLRLLSRPVTARTAAVWGRRLRDRIFRYSGHGAQNRESGANYLIRVDATAGYASKARGCGWGRSKRPVIRLYWDDITKEYLPRMSGTTGNTYRLATEQYTARVGSGRRYSCGDDIGENRANCDGCTFMGTTSRRPRSGPLRPLLRPLRHARQCLGVGAGVLGGQLLRCALNDASARPSAFSTSRNARGGSCCRFPHALALHIAKGTTWSSVAMTPAFWIAGNA